MLPCIRGTDYRLIIHKAYWLMMCNAVAQTVYFFQLIEYKRVIVLYGWRTYRF